MFNFFCVVELVQTLPNGDVCPGENITFTCITTDALGLIWRQPLFSNVPFDDIKDEPKSEGSFTFVLLDVVNSTTFISTATLKNASESNNSTRITCSDGTDTEEKSISIAGKHLGTNLTSLCMSLNKENTSASNYVCMEVFVQLGVLLLKITLIS